MRRILILLVLGFALKTYGCDCLTPKTADALKSADAVFVGRIISYHVNTNLYSASVYGQVEFYNFEVIRYYKGLSKKNKIISLVSSGSNCDIQFKYHKAGDVFIVYAYLNGDWLSSHLLSTRACSRTKLVSEITEKEELDVYNDPGYWKDPENLKLTEIENKPLSNVIPEQKTDSKFLTVLVGISILLNVIILFLLVKKRTNKF